MLRYRKGFYKIIVWEAAFVRSYRFELVREKTSEDYLIFNFFGTLISCGGKAVLKNLIKEVMEGSYVQRSYLEFFFY